MFSKSYAEILTEARERIAEGFENDFLELKKNN